MTIWFTADNHWGHGNIIDYTNRPFASTEEMDREMIRRWNDVVRGPGDVVYHLGDLTLGGFVQAKAVLEQLHGTIKVLANPWHHDRRWLPVSIGPTYMVSKSNVLVATIPPMVVLELDTFGASGYPHAITLCHYPLAEWDRKHYGGWMLHGHSHGKHQGEGFILDVGVDANEFYPVSLGDVAEMMERQGWCRGWQSVSGRVGEIARRMEVRDGVDLKP